MFFIGSLNSVLPYVIYLSLIWVFLLVGVSGKVLQARQILSPRLKYSDNLHLQNYDSRVIYYYDHHTLTPTREALKDQPVFPWITCTPDDIKIIKSFYEADLSFDSQYYSSFSFRGPPAGTL